MIAALKMSDNFTCLPVRMAWSLINGFFDHRHEICSIEKLKSLEKVYRKPVKKDNR